jgi:hypothetical protein
MPNQRKPLTDKEERILVQAQLMGLTTANMVKIGNRLRALEKESEEQHRITENIHGYSWTEQPTTETMSFTDPDGLLIVANQISKSWSNSGWSYRQSTYTYDLTVSKPGTKMAVKLIPDVTLHCDYDWKKRMMPGNSKQFYALMCWCNINLHRHLNKK